MLASSWADPVLGLDIHWEFVPTPAGPIPTPIPNPFVGIVFDPKGLAMGLAISNAINAVTGSPLTGPVLYWGAFPATNTGTDAKHVPGHIILPPGVSWAPVPKTPKPVIHPGETPDPPKPVKPDDDAVCVFGSKTVSVMGSNAVRLGDILMSCSEPIRLPSSVVLAIPKGAPIMIGGPMSLDIMAAIFASLRTRFVSDSLHALLSRMKPSRFRDLISKGICFLTGHPVDVASGRVLTDAVDAELPGVSSCGVREGHLPLKVQRCYSSARASRSGLLGHGWSLSLDQAVWRERGRVVYLAEDGRELEFDSFDFPEHTLQPGQELRHPYDGLRLRAFPGDVWEITSRDGVVRRFGPVAGRGDGRAMIQRIRSRDGFHEITFAYDGRGRLASVRDSSDRLMYLEHDFQDRVVALKLPVPHGRGWYVHRRYDYDAEGDLVRVTDAEGSSWSFEYVSHLLTRETDRTGLSFYFAYDGLGEDAWCIRTWGDGGIYDHVISYDKAGHVTFVADSLGQTTSYHMNLAGLVVKVVDPLGGETRYEYNLDTFEETLKEAPLGDRTEKRYDQAGNLVEIIEAGGVTTRLEYDATSGSQPTRAVDARGGVWEWRYDRLGHLVERILPTGERLVLTWRDGLLAGTESAAGQRLTFEYDAEKNIVAIRERDGGVHQYEWDHLGRVIRARTPIDGTTRFRYDGEGRPIETELLSGVVQRVAYDPEGNVVEVQDGTRHERYGYSQFHRLAWEDEAGARVQYEYDTEGRLSGVVNEAGDRFGFSRDANGRVVREIGFDGGVRSYQLDQAGRITRTVLPSGRASDRAYDIVGRLLEVKHSDGTFGRFQYDIGGLLIAAENESSRVDFERDPAGRVIAERTDGHEVRSRYDASGERSEITTSLGTQVAIARDVFGKPQDLFFGADRLRADVQLERDASGVERVRRFSNGIELRWGRDLAGRPTSRTTYLHSDPYASVAARPFSSAPPPREVDARMYEWRGDDHVAAVIDARTGPRVYDHDARGRLIRERDRDVVTVRAMDAVANVYRTPSGSDRQYGPGGRLDVADGVRYEYDRDGNQIRKVEPDGSVWNFSWDGHGMLSEVQRPDGVRVKYSYDAFARRTAKRTVAANGSPAHQVRFVWDGHAVIHELGSAQELVTWYWEPETLTPVAKEQGGRRWTIAADDFGTPTEMYDESGRLTWKMRLDVFGTATFDAGRAAECPWRWSGQYADNEESLVYNRFRYYDPQRGSFVSADPVGLLGGTNPFAYVPDPASTSDPFGLGATIDDRGFFAPTNEYGRGTSPKGRVRIPYQGTRDRDFTLANKQAKFKETPHGYTWHHANYNSRTGYGDMQLVRKTAHATGHSGGVSEFKAATGIDYDGNAAVKHVENEGRLKGRPCP